MVVPTQADMGLSGCLCVHDRVNCFGVVEVEGEGPEGRRRAEVS